MSSIDFDVVIVGAGLVGLAIARALVQEDSFDDPRTFEITSTN